MLVADSTTERYATVMDTLIGDCTRLDSDCGTKTQRQQRAIDVESRKKAIGGKSEAKRRLECLHFEIDPATPRSHVSVA